ncbi:MAG: flagellar basal body P-ring protein FlgI [Candidatus Margulisbacteria bacterium]|nr:flagellar basal body P-ring protein FlgI [Candidatus Margulisiibacteriota bacterium]
MLRQKYSIIFFLTLAACCLTLCLPAHAASLSARIKDIGHILEARDNQLMGFGLVVGLYNTGDKTATGFTQQALTNLLSRMGVVPQSVNFKSRNVAAVMVTATLPPFIKSGQKIDVNVASMGDATSLQGGTLLITPLHGVDDKIYAVAQGSLIVGVEPSSPIVPYIKQRQTNAGRIPGGALVEKEVPVNLGDKGVLTIVLNEPDFTTANRAVDSIRRSGLDAVAKDAGTISIPLAGEEDLISLIAKVENLTVIPEVVAKIVVNERTGTIVIGENVRIAPVAVSYAGIDVLIDDINLYSEGNATDVSMDENSYRALSTAKIKRPQAKLRAIPAGASLSSLVKALNRIGASPKDLVAILQAMKRVGAIKAGIEVI